MSEFTWTGQQAAAIQAAAHTLLEANAGTGKTTSVVGKIAWLLGLPVGVDEETGSEIPPCSEPCRLDEIAAVTFTEKAAYDLKKKLRERILDSPRAGELRWQLERASIGTIHSFCAEILKEHALRLGLDPAFRVLDEQEARLELDQIIQDLVVRRLTDGDEAVAALVQNYGLRKRGHADGAVDFVRAALRDLRWHPDRYPTQPGAPEILDGDAVRARFGEQFDAADEAALEGAAALYGLAVEASFLWASYQDDENVLDFDALILKTRDLLRGSEAAAALAGLRRRYRILIIDEFQDTDGAQRDIAFAIAGLGGDVGPREGERLPQLYFVGDPKQSIYRFRGADVAVWNEVKAVLRADEPPDRLTVNFRSDEAVVDFVNAVCRPAMEGTNAELQALKGRGQVDYARLEARHGRAELGGVEWLEVDPDLRADERRAAEAQRVAARIRQLVDPAGDGSPGARLYDHEERRSRCCRYRDIAILFRSRTGLEKYEEALRAYGVPYYLVGDAALTQRQEIVDLLTALRVIDDRRDDLRVFAYLRSPFVGLRDEVLARIQRFGEGWTLFQKAKNHIDSVDWFPAPEDPEIVDIEREALRTGLSVIEELAPLRSRWPLDRLLETLLDRAGYRAHLELMAQPEPKLANIQRFLRLLDGYREHTLGSFLELWALWEEKDLGIPQAPLFSKEDDVVKLSTIHSAKGLEWPVVFLVDVKEERSPRKYAREFWSDRDYGPNLAMAEIDRGARGEHLRQREICEDVAESARILYVAATRAKNRLIIAGPTAESRGHAGWLAAGLSKAAVNGAVPMVSIPTPIPEPGLDWLKAISEGRPPDSAAAIPTGRLRFARSATELMTRQRSRMEWSLKYRHGVIPRWYFAPSSAAGDIPGWVRGTLIHGVLERVGHTGEVSDLLDVAIGALDSPELEERLARGTEYRSKLEAEIERVVSSDEWRWYTEAEHHRELRFAHLVNDRKWRVGAFDLFRSGDPNWVIDFKTHEIGPDQVEATADGYRLQALVYRAAARALAGETRVRLHFTRPNRTVDID